MAIVKARGFNRGRNKDDYVGIVGAENTIEGRYITFGKGAHWGPTIGGTAERVNVGASSSTYPGVSGSASYSSYLEQIGNVGEFHAKGGFCVTIFAKLQPNLWRYLASPDGETVVVLNELKTYQTTPDFFNIDNSHEITPTPGSGNLSIAVGTGYRVNIENNQLLYGVSNYVAMWDNINNPTEYTRLTVSGLNPRLYARGVTSHDGYYYFYGDIGSSSAAGIVYRNTEFSLTGLELVFNEATSPTTRLKWMPEHNKFILLGCTGGTGFSIDNGRATIWTSTDGTTWTKVFEESSTSPSTILYDFAIHPTSGLIAAVGFNGYIVTSEDGGVTWIKRNSGTSEKIVNLDYFNGEFIGITSLGNTLISPDGLIWTFVSNSLSYVGVTNYAFWRTTVVKNELYAFSDTISNRQILLKYVGAGNWDQICNYTWSNSLYSNTGIPTGVFFASPYSGTGSLSNAMIMQGLNMSTTGIYSYRSSSGSIWSAQTQVTTAEDNNWHKIQVDFVARPKDPSAPTTAVFDASLYVDDTFVETTPALKIPESLNAWACTSSCGFNLFSDLVVTDYSGNAMVGRPLNDIQIRPRVLTTDVQAQWDKVPSTLNTNVEAAQGNGSVYGSTSSVQSSVIGSTDQYSGPAVEVPMGYKISAVSVTSSFQRTGIPEPTVELSMLEGGASLPVQSKTLTGTTVEFNSLNALYPTKLDGTGWTAADIEAATVQIKHSA